MMLQSFGPRWPFPNNAPTGLLTACRRSLVPGGVPRTVAGRGQARQNINVNAK